MWSLAAVWAKPAVQAFSPLQALLSLLLAKERVAAPRVQVASQKNCLDSRGLWFPNYIEPLQGLLRLRFGSPVFYFGDPSSGILLRPVT